MKKDQRWDQACQAIMEVADLASRYDDDGIDVYFLNNKRVGKELRSSDDVEELFTGLGPRGITPCVVSKNGENAYRCAYWCSLELVGGWRLSLETTCLALKHRNIQERKSSR